MASVRLAGITVRFGEGPAAIDDIDLVVRRGEFLVLAGPSGSGKTTLLRVIAGLEAPARGSVLFDGEEVTGVPPSRRGVAMVFQEHALHPTRTVERNIAFPLETRKVPAEERHRRVVQEARAMGVEALLERYPGRLAAGHRQAVATARALIRECSVVLMDEPLAHLDARARAEARVELQRIHRDLDATVLYVTNDQVEAMALGDRVALLEGGRIRQIGEPMELYRRPVDRFVAEFLGSPSMRVVPAELAAAAEGAELVIGADRITLGEGMLSRWPGIREWLGMPLGVGIRPEGLGPADASHPFARCLHGTVAGVAEHGYGCFVEIDLGSADAAVLARFPPGWTPGMGERIEVALDTERLVFFDPLSGRAIW